MKKPTMQNIADDLGMSRTTVSLVLTGKADRYRISRRTQERVLERVRELDFTPNYFARALNRNRSGVVGVVFPNVFEQFITKVVKGIEDELYGHGYTMMLCTSRFNTAHERRILRDLAHRSVDGYIISAYAPFCDEEHDVSHLHSLVSGNKPVVFVDRYLPDLPAHRVVQNDFQSGVAATQALVRRGCTRLLCVTFDMHITSLAARVRGFHHALSTADGAGVAGSVLRLESRDEGSEDLTTALARCMAKTCPPDGFLVTTNGLAYRTRQVLESLGYSHGADVHLAKFGSDPLYHRSGMICVEQPHLQMGQMAARALLSLLQGTADTAPLEQVVDSRLRIPEQDHVPQGVSYETQ